MASAVPSLPRPAKGFTSASARKWVLTSALVSGLIYLVRHLVEGETSPAPSTNAARQFLGQGSPPNVSQWFIAYATGYLGLALLAVAAPEIAASLAIFVLAVTVLESGGQLAKDLGELEAGQGTFNATANSASVLAQSEADQAQTFATQNFPVAPAPAKVWTGVGSGVKSDLPNIFEGKPTTAKAVPPANGGITGTYNPVTGEYN